jgi:inner membrane protein
MASFGHLAVGMMAGRLHGGRPGDGRTPASGARCWAAIAGFALLAALPDADLLAIALGLPDGNAVGHRGGSHSLLTAIALGVGAGLLARRLGSGALRTALAVTVTVASHGILDACGHGGRGIPLFWPLSDHRFLAPWRFLPDAPRGLKFLSWKGLDDLAVEFVYFLPLTAYALWPRRAARPADQELPMFVAPALPPPP